MYRKVPCCSSARLSNMDALDPLLESTILIISVVFLLVHLFVFGFLLHTVLIRLLKLVMKFSFKPLYIIGFNALLVYSNVTAIKYRGLYQSGSCKTNKLLFNFIYIRYVSVCVCIIFKSYFKYVEIMISSNL